MPMPSTALPPAPAAALLHRLPSTRPARLACAGLAGLVLGGCAQQLQSSDGFFSRITPYRIEIVQGNVVTREQAEAVRVGMTRAQVRDILGSPLVTSAFHVNRWDYVFTIRRQGAEPQQRRILALFDGDRLTSLDTGGELPSEREFVASIDTGRSARKAPVLELTEQQLSALPKPKRDTVTSGAVTPSEPVPPTRSFPPLEATR
jgi:outer membrane protein assembly factor BamE